ncbi:MAG: hypothetical protein ACP5KD_08745 [Fervidobacterium sp.]|jgi:hypothetical protein
MIVAFENIVFGSLISTLIGSLLAVLISYEIVAKKARLRYQSLYFFNEIMTMGALTLLWYYLDSLYVIFPILSILSITYQLYKLLVSIYSLDKRFRLLILSLGTSHAEYSRFILEKNLGKMIGNLLKFYTISLISFLVSMNNYASDIGFFSLIVGLALTLLQSD